MNLDLSDALDDLARDAGRQSDLGPVDRLMARRKRRRTVRRSATAAAGLAVVGGLAFAGGTLANWQHEPQPAVTGPNPTPTPTVEPSVAALPGCGDPLPPDDPASGDPEPTTLTAEAPESLVAGTPVSVRLGISGPAAPAPEDLADADIRLVISSDGRVVALADAQDASWTDSGNGPVAQIEAAPEYCEAAPDAGVLTAVVRTADGLLVSAGVDVTVEAPDGSADDDDPISTRPLRDPFVHRANSGTSISSDAPSSADTLADGDYAGRVLSVDPAAGTVTVDLVLFFTGEHATAWARANDPRRLEPEGWVLNDMLEINEVERPRTLTLAPDAVITGYCLTDGTLTMRARTLADLMTEGDRAACQDAESGIPQFGGEGGSLFWVDVRGGVVAQLVGQYVP